MIITVTLTTLSFPTVSNLFFVSSKNIYDTLCFTSWNVARGARLKYQSKHVNLNRVRTEIGNQNSRTFPGLFKDYLHFFQESFFIDGNSPNTAYTQDFCPIQDRKRISLLG